MMMSQTAPASVQLDAPTPTVKRATTLKSVNAGSRQKRKATKEELQHYQYLAEERLGHWQETLESSPEPTVGPYRQWSPSAVACFVRNAQCEGCFYSQFFGDSDHGCQMVEAVKHLLTKLGPPNKRQLSKLS